MGYFHASKLLKLAFVSSLTRKYVLWKGFYHDFSTKKASASPDPHQGALSLDPRQWRCPLDSRGSFAPLPIYPGAALVKVSCTSWPAAFNFLRNKTKTKRDLYLIRSINENTSEICFRGLTFRLKIIKKFVSRSKAFRQVKWCTNILFTVHNLNIYHVPNYYSYMNLVNTSLCGAPWRTG